MKLRLFLLSLGLLLLLMAFTNQATLPTLAQTTGRIAGLVTAANGAPLAGIEVTVYQWQSFGPGSTPAWVAIGAPLITDAAGAYQSLFLTPDQYILRFVDPNDHYGFTYYANATTLAAATRVPVVANQTTSDINVQLTPGARLTGTIRLYDGTLVTQIAPQKYLDGLGQPHYTRGSLYLNHFDGESWTFLRQINFDDDPRMDLTTSTYRLGGLAAGRYRLAYHVKYGNGVDADMAGHCATVGNVGHIYAESYLDAPTVAEGTDIVVTPGQMSQTINLVVGGNPTYGRLQGRVTNSAGAPLTDMVLMLYTEAANGAGGSAECAGITDLDGRYTSPALPTGRYRIGIFDPTGLYAPAYYGNTENFTAATPLTLTPGATLTDLAVTLHPAKRLVGRLLMADGAQPDQVKELYALRETSDGELFTSYPGLNEPTTGSYTIAGLPNGAYRLYYRVQQAGIEYATTFPSPILVPVTSGESTRFDLTIAQSSAQGGVIRGQVTDDAGQPLAGIHVNLGIVKFDTAYATTDNNGAYQLSAGAGENLAYLVTFADPQRRYAFQYYQQASNAAAATPLPMITPTVYSGINAALAPGGRITGQITLIDGTPLSQVAPYELNPLTGQPARGLITLSQRSGDQWQAIETIWVGDQNSDSFDLATNTYTFAGLAPGAYQLYVRTHHQGVLYHSLEFPPPDAAIQVTAGNTTQADLRLGQDDARVLALYALALDNDPDRIDNLAPQLQPAMQSILAATTNDPNKLAVVLVDAAGEGDSHIYVVQNGRAQPLHGLPDATLTLNPALTEANMADGAQLGYFIRWARNSYPAQVTLFSYAGHGAPLTPAVSWETISQLPGPAGQAAAVASQHGALQNLFPLPARVDTYPSLTDQHPLALISPYALAEALRIGANNGADPIQIADITHCFAATIEELYELSPGAQPYVEIILASPTYTYLDPPALGAALAAINTTYTPERMADKIIAVYDQLLAQADQRDGDEAVEHPRLLVAVNSRQLARLKADWDQVAAALLQPLDAAKLRQAYLAARYYDTTLCQPQDWELGPPDALVDLAAFAGALQQVYGPTSPVGRAAGQVLADFATVITGKYVRSGSPWYATRPEVFWDFSNHQGIALFADLQGRPSTKPNTVELSWQAHWYTATNINGDNPHPFAFLQQSASGVTWADLLTAYWQAQGVTVETILCAPDALVNPQVGELRAVGLVYPITGTLGVGALVPLAAAIESAGIAIKPAVQFNLYDVNQHLLFTTTVRAGYLITGVHQLIAPAAYTPTAPGPLTVELLVDPDQQFQEQNEQDNRWVQQYAVAEGAFQPLTIAATLADVDYFTDQATAPLRITTNRQEALRELKADLYQYQPKLGSRVWLPRLVSSQLLDPADPKLTLLFLQPGPVIAHLWARGADGVYSATPAILSFTYAPLISLAGGQSQYYLLPVAGQSIELLAPVGAANLFAWSPFNGWSPDWLATPEANQKLTLPATNAGGYLVAVTAVRAGHFQVTSNAANRESLGRVEAATAATALLPAFKPELLAPIVLPPQQTEAAPVHLQQRYFPFAAQAQATTTIAAIPGTDQLRYTDHERGFHFLYPALYEEAPYQQHGCGLQTQTLDSGGLFFSQPGDRLITFGADIHLAMRSMGGLPLADYVEIFSEELRKTTSALTRDDERFNREPRGYVFTATSNHHPLLFALFGRDDIAYLFMVRLSLACQLAEGQRTVEDVFWAAVESFGFE